MSTATPVPLQPTKRAYILWLAVGLILVLLLAVAVAWQGTAKVRALKGSNEDFLAWNKHQTGVKTTASGLEYKVIKQGEGPAPTDQDIALVTYALRDRSGKVLQAAQQPVPLPVAPARDGQGGVVPGMSEALKLMNKGSRYRVWIKPELGYGHSGKDGAIAPDQLLDFDVELLEFTSMQQFQQMMMMQQMQQQQGAGGPPPGAPGGQ